MTTAPVRPPTAPTHRFGRWPSALRPMLVLVLVLVLVGMLGVGVLAGRYWSAGVGPDASAGPDTEAGTATNAAATDAAGVFNNRHTRVAALLAAIAEAQAKAEARSKAEGHSKANASTNGDLLQLLERTVDLLQDQAEQQQRLQTELIRLRRKQAAAERTWPAHRDAPATAVGLQRAPERQQQLQRLLATGATPAEADALLAFTDELQLQHIEARYRLLRDAADDNSPPRGRASPERSRTLSRELRALGDTAQQVRDTFGDATYDRYLYATAQPNRVRVARVLPGSSAERAGLAPGDLLLSYDRQPVRSLDDVLRAAAHGSEGESAALELMRGNERVLLSLPRGPVGIQGHGESINPARVQN